MKTLPARLARSWSAAILAGLFFAVRPSPAQWVEVSVHLESVLFPSSPAAPQAERWSTNTARCVFGTNLWLIEGDFSLNARHTFWTTATNIIDEFVITKLLPEPEGDKSRHRLAMRPLPVGERRTILYPPSEKQPLRGMAQLTWLAFCSGSFLKSDGRMIAPLYPSANREQFSDNTRLFDGALALPERVELYQACHGPLFSVYQVLQSTNFVGRTVPVRFEYKQYQRHGPSAGELSGRTTGTVTTIREGKEPPALAFSRLVHETPPSATKPVDLK